ncbi:MAG: hypothetical protein CL782_05325 [Chloroflexi bacterium]|nr:hypothetical protein [Chloroflexota bacterium]|tara:strand:+ start:477 stop:1301 length:825 start_codon:yes stop_codon:yes gene_type:complete
MRKQERICQACGVSLSPDAKFCQKCGQIVDSVLRTEGIGTDFRGNQPPRPKFISLFPRAKWTQRLLIVFVGLSILSIILDMMDINLLKNIHNFTATEAEINNNALIWGIWGVGYTLVYLVTIITFLRWIYQASSNLNALGYVSQRFSPAWAVGWWFIPFMHLFRPYQVMNEIWKSSHPNNKYTPGVPSAGTYKIDIGSNLIGWWWALWIVSNVLENIIMRMWFRAEDLQIKELIELTYFNMLVTSLTVIPAVIVFILINQITNNQEIKSQSSVN